MSRPFSKKITMVLRGNRNWPKIGKQRGKAKISQIFEPNLPYRKARFSECKIAIFILISLVFPKNQHEILINQHEIRVISYLFPKKTKTLLKCSPRNLRSTGKILECPPMILGDIRRISNYSPQSLEDIRTLLECSPRTLGEHSRVSYVFLEKVREVPIYPWRNELNLSKSLQWSCWMKANFSSNKRKHWRTFENVSNVSQRSLLIT